MKALWGKIEEFVFGKVAGRVLARLAVSAAALVAAKAAAVGIDVDPAQLSAAMMAGANAAWTWIKDWRDKRAAKAAAGAEAKPA